MGETQDIKPDEVGAMPQTLLAGVANVDNEIDHNQHLIDASRRTVAARLKQLAPLLATADDAASAAITEYMAEAKAAVQGEDGEAMVQWCDEHRQRFWVLTGQA